jgi:hypothetical protein
MSQTMIADPEPMLLEEIEPAPDPAFDALLRSFERESAPANPPRSVPFHSTRRDPYYLD